MAAELRNIFRLEDDIVPREVCRGRLLGTRMPRSSNITKAMLSNILSTNFCFIVFVYI